MASPRPQPPEEAPPLRLATQRLPCLVWLFVLTQLALFWLSNALSEPLHEHGLPSRYRPPLSPAPFSLAPRPATLKMAAGGGGPRPGFPGVMTSARCASAGGGRRESLARAWGSGGGRDERGRAGWKLESRCRGGRGRLVGWAGDCGTRSRGRRGRPQPRVPASGPRLTRAPRRCAP